MFPFWLRFEIMQREKKQKATKWNTNLKSNFM